MNLGTVAARRMVLRRGAGMLAALFATGAAGHQSPAPSPGWQSAPLNPCSETENDYRRNLAKLFFDKQRALDRKKWLTYRAWHEQDADLRVLQSTSPSFRASVMYDRLKARDSISDAISDRIDAIWQTPFAKLQEIAAKWVGEIL